MWYRDGTVQVTNGSNAIIGTGANFVANARVGDALKGPDGEWYEITNIASATTFSIRPNYAGPTATGQAYSITPVQGYNKLLSDEVLQIIADTTDLNEDVSQAVATAQASAAASVVSKDAAHASELASAASAALSDQDRIDAQAARDVAVAAKNAAGVSETNASNSAGAASASATAASNSKDAAHTSEVNAAASAAAAAAATDIQDNLTSTATNKPLSANQGRILNGLIQGSNATLTSYEYVATAGQTVFSGNDRNGLSMAVNPGISLVVVNGSLNLKTTDYTLTNTTLTLVGGNPLAAGDIVQIIGFGQFNIADVYTKAQADARFPLVGSDVTLLASGVSWDTLTTPGHYYIPSASGTNAPASGSSWFLSVEKSGSVIRQNARQQNSSATMSRTYVSSWSGWDLSFNRSNILGTVSQVAGLPTGAVIESGTNANGTYARFADGTQVCWKNFVSGPVAFSAGPIYTSASASAGSFPIAFLAGTTPRVVATGYAGTGGWPGVYAAATATTWGNWAMYKEVVQSTGNTVMDLIAIGRWF